MSGAAAARGAQRIPLSYVAVLVPVMAALNIVGGFIISIVKTPQYANLDYLENMTGKLQKEIETIPEAGHVFAINGSGGVRQAPRSRPETFEPRCTKPPRASM